MTLRELQAKLEALPASRLDWDVVIQQAERDEVGHLYDCLEPMLLHAAPTGRSTKNHQIILYCARATPEEELEDEDEDEAPRLADRPHLACHEIDELAEVIQDKLKARPNPVHERFASFLCDIRDAVGDLELEFFGNHEPGYADDAIRRVLEGAPGYNGTPQPPASPDPSKPSRDLSLLDRVHALWDLRVDWDAQGSPPPGAQILNRAARFALAVPTPHIATCNVAPLSGGGVQFTWRSSADPGWVVDFELLPGQPTRMHVDADFPYSELQLLFRDLLTAMVDVVSGQVAL